MELYKGKYFEVVFEDWCQEFPGACIISGHKECLGDMTSDEWQELGILEKELERVCKKVFGATMFNFACLMNNAYRDNEKPHVHFWFVPRYRNELKLFNKVYKDKHFGYNFWKWALSRFKSQKDIFTKEERLKIFEMMKDEFKID
jgi:diadenosine tetraphosphate (Ap4A) HIT family hydrolase